MEDLKQQYLDEMKSMINQIQIKDYRNERIDIRYRRECEIKIDELKGKFNGMSIKINKKKELRQLEQAANVSTHTPEPSRHFNSICYDDDDEEESSIAITPDFPITNSLIMEDELLDTILETKSDKENESSVEDLNLTPKLLSNDSLSLPENESFHFDHFYDPSPPRPPAKPPDDDGIHFDIEPDTGILTAKVVDDIFEHYVLMPSILTTHPTNCPVIDTLLPFSSENENKVFNSGILSSNEEKSPHLLFHQGFKAYQIIFDFSKSRIMIYGRDSTILDVPFLHSDSLINKRFMGGNPCIS
ncbi:hypothetical protein Tco_1364528 [Tanacetum coccineum]